jgi:hypothetical protein
VKTLHFDTETRSMPNWLMSSIVGSIVLTLLLNLLPMLFPKSARRAQERIIEEIQKQHTWEDDAARPGPLVKVFFPWKTMLFGSLLLTAVLNAFNWWAARRG